MDYRERLQMIDNKVAQVKQELAEEHNKQTEAVAQATERLFSLGERVTELLTIANYAKDAVESIRDDADFSIEENELYGKLEYQVIPFDVSGTVHRYGLHSDGKGHINAIAFSDYNGKYHCFNADEVWTECDYNHSRLRLEMPTVEEMNNLYSRFPAFESKFYAYVDSVFAMTDSHNNNDQESEV